MAIGRARRRLFHFDITFLICHNANDIILDCAQMNAQPTHGPGKFGVHAHVMLSGSV